MSDPIQETLGYLLVGAAIVWFAGWIAYVVTPVDTWNKMWGLR